MRMNIYYSLLLMILLSVASIGCSDNNVEWESDEVPSDKITLDMQGTLDLLHNESAVVKIVLAIQSQSHTNRNAKFRNPDVRFLHLDGYLL